MLLKKIITMYTTEIKNHLHQLIVETNDKDILTKIQAYIKQLKSKNADWYNELSQKTKDDIEISLQQAQNEEGIPNNEARKRIDHFFKQKND